MSFLENPNSSYLILSSQKIDDMVSVLYAKEYQIIPIKGYYQGNFEESIIAFSNSIDNDELRKDALLLLNQFDENSAIIKYKGDDKANKLLKGGSERPLGVVLYNTDGNNVSYLYNDLSFSFVESKRYWKPTKKEDFKIGMIVEYLNNNKWFQKEVQKPEEEYEKFFKLLIKYDKLRVASTK